MAYIPKLWKKISGIITPFNDTDNVSVSNNDLILPKDSGKGIKVDINSPTFGYKDLVGQIIPRAGGAPAPLLVAFRGTYIKNYAFQAGDIIDNITFHIPHDYAPGTDMYLHVHWGHHGTAISGNLVIDWYITYCKGYNQSGQTFNSEINVTQTIPTPNITTIPQYAHNIHEFQFTNNGGNSTHIDRNLLEIDGLIQIALKTTTIPTITGGATNLPFIFTVDIHYQSSGIATKNKNYPFYT